MLMGWSFMWIASDLFWLLGSRFLVGLGHSFCMGQLKIYITEKCEEKLKIIMTKQISLQAFFGVAVMVSFGSFLNFDKTAIISMIITAGILLIMLFLPQSSEALATAKKIRQPCISNCSIKKSPFFHVFRDKNLRKNFLIFFILVLCQQYSGVAATIVYSQIIFEKFHCEYPKFFAIAYMVTYFFANIVGVFVIPKYNKRSVLLLSSLGVSLVIILEIIVSLVKIEQTYWSYTSIAVIYLYLIIHTLGLGNIPFTLIADLFPVEYRTSIAHFFIMFHSMLALTITKIFQVIITKKYHISIAFGLFLCFSFSAFVFSYFVLVIKTEKVRNIYVVSQARIKKTDR